LDKKKVSEVLISQATKEVEKESYFNLPRNVYGTTGET